MEIDLKPVDHITTDAIGSPGQRVFYIQGWKAERCITLVVEKIQVQSLAIGVEEFLGEIVKKFPDLPSLSTAYDEDKMHIQPPIDPLFRVREFSLGYSVENDMIVLIAQQLLSEDQDASEASVVRFWCTRSQIYALSLWGLEVTSRGRPTCPLCGQPMNPNEKHFCPKKNGRQH
jgi:uncharacterized repeat protein (TIGR03847 family)